jgi:DNA repair exonuclease SbcCD ATPase subunit
MDSPQQELQRSFHRLQLQVAEANPELYRQLALYLQVLRDGLMDVCRQACFHLATQVHPQRYSSLAKARRRSLQRRLGNLVARASCLLTVEQLAHLASELQQEKQEQQQDRQQRLIRPVGQRPGSDAPATPATTAKAPAGSVHLGLDLPIGRGLIDVEGISAMALDPGLGSNDVLDDFLAADLGDAQEDVGDKQSSLADMVGALSSAMLGSSSELNRASPWQVGRLPTEPLLLMHWLEGFELALGRRLRNLSNALNMELLRQGITPAMLPNSLLEAVLRGQFEALPAPANLLRVPLPFPADVGGDSGAPEALVVLLRPSDLEQELPALRTCRRRLQQAQQQLRRMAQESTRLQARLATLEAEQLWLQDIEAWTRLPPDPPNLATNLAASPETSP